MKKILCMILCVCILSAIFAGCEEVTVAGSKADTRQTIKTANTLQENQPTPTDIEYSVPRYLLIRRAYFVNGQREKARMLPCPIADMPLGHVVLLTDNGSVVGKYIVEGMVISLNTYLTPDSELYEMGEYNNIASHSDNYWLADVDGTYGENDSGIFFFTPEGLYFEWSGDYLYTDMPILIDDPIIRVGE